MAPNEIIQRLLEMQKQRDRQWNQHVTKMFSAVPNVTRALETMLGLPPDDIKWVEIEASDGILLMGVAIKFPADRVPMFVQIFAPTSIEGIDDDVDIINQLIRIGVPLELVDKDVGDIIQFFYDLANENEDEDGTEEGDPSTLAVSTPDNPIFDSTELTLEQTQKLLLFQNHISDVKH